MVSEMCIRDRCTVVSSVCSVNCTVVCCSKTTVETLKMESLNALLSPLYPLYKGLLKPSIVMVGHIQGVSKEGCLVSLFLTIELRRLIL